MQGFHRDSHGELQTNTTEAGWLVCLEYEFIAHFCCISQALNIIPFQYELWWFPEFVRALRLDKEVSISPITQNEVIDTLKPWRDGNDTIMGWLLYHNYISDVSHPLKTLLFKFLLLTKLDLKGNSQTQRH